MNLLKKYKNYKTFCLLLGLFGAFFMFSGLVFAQTVLQGYASDEKLQRGMLVATKDGDDKKVVALTDKTIDKFKGVVVEKNDSPVTISNEEQKIFVATSGPYEVLVSDENGPIKKGDFVSISTASGIGAVATEDSQFVVGVAAGDFAGGGDSLSTAKSSSGKDVKVGRIKVDVAFGKNPGAKDKAHSKVPGILKNISESVADKPLSAARIYLSFTVFVATVVVSGIVLFSGIRSGVIAIGRNPLSKKTIYRGLMQVIVLGLIIFIVGIFGVYLVLKL